MGPNSASVAIRRPFTAGRFSLVCMDQAELHQFQEFFRAMAGRAENFAFTDPWTGRVTRTAAWGAIT